jgi:methionine synthase I (cobalamin-dependent)
VYVSAHPNAGLPNPLAETGYDESPEYTASLIKDLRNRALSILSAVVAVLRLHISRPSQM